MPDAWYDAPTFYFTNPHAILGPDDEVCFPGASRARDLELEVAVVVGKPGSSLSVDEAAQHVFGYTIMNDWSARDVQGREMQVGLGPAKGKDFGTTLGPWIVTADELEPYRDADGFLDLWCTVTVNGDEIGRDLLSDMGWTFETHDRLRVSRQRVEPGDVLGSGTVGNGGCLAELWGRRGTAGPAPAPAGRRGHPDRRRSGLPDQHGGSRRACARTSAGTSTRPRRSQGQPPMTDLTGHDGGRDRSRLGDRGRGEDSGRTCRRHGDRPRPHDHG